MKPLGAGALVLAGAGEAVIRAGNYSGLGGALYLAAIALFAVGAWPMPAAPAAEAGVASDTPRRGPSSLSWLTAGVLLALAANVALLRRLREHDESGTTVFLWILSAALLLAAGLLGARSTAFAPRWETGWWPRSRAGRATLLAAVTVVLVLAARCRLWDLDTIPFGINADEGDRAAVSIQILRGTNTTSVFGFGWYHISMVFFRLLAAVMRLSPTIGVGGARLFAALCGTLTVPAVMLIGFRHFGRRAGLLAGGLMAALGPAIQFSRHLSEAAPTLLLWAVSGALFLEAARGGKAWAWIGAGLAGGFSIYFYPTGRLWPVLAALFCVALLLQSRGLRGRVAAGTVVAALAALAIMSPFLLRMWEVPDEFVVRARETTIFVKENPRRLTYYDSKWSTPRLVAEQVNRALGIFDKYADANFFWPTEKPILPPALAALTLLGLGAACLRWKDPRLTLLAIWFWVGFVGVIVTVETPNLHRMSTTMPVLALLPALVLDDVARRTEGLSRSKEGLAAWVPSVAAGAAAVLLMAREVRFYFGEYAKRDAWAYTRVEGQTVREQGKDAWVMSLGNQFHMVNSGWVRLLAPQARRAGILSPGDDVPPPLPANRDLAFLVYGRQSYYLPFLADVLPGGTAIRVTHPPDVYMMHVYRVPRAVWEAAQGALALPPGGAAVRVPALGEPPAGWARFPSPMSWTAALVVDRYWNYGFRARGPARLTIDGTEVLHAADGETAEATVSLAKGDHQVVLEGLLAAPRGRVDLEWAPPLPTDPQRRRWTRVATPRLRSLERPQGLAGFIDVPDRPSMHRIDRAIAFGGLSDEIHHGGPFAAAWEGTLSTKVGGTYHMVLFGQGRAELTLDAARVLQKPEGQETGEADVPLAAGAHRVSLAYHASGSPAWLEWIWTPPGGAPSIVPPSVLAPPAGAGIGPELPPESLGSPDKQPRGEPFHSVY